MGTPIAGAIGAGGGAGIPWAARLRRFFAVAGPGMLVAVGYIDPGNWATDIAGGARFSYSLLFVILLSNLIAVLLQVLSVRLGIAARLDLAEACREAYPRARIPLWIIAELAIAATDLAEVLGSAIALGLLFHVPLAAGVVVTSLDVLLLLGLGPRSARWLEGIALGLILVVAGCFAFELALSRPDPGAVIAGYLPSARVVGDPDMLYLAMGILGATVMPHNLFLHSSLVQGKTTGRGEDQRRIVARLATVDTVISLGLAMLLNSAILILAASTFHRAGRTEVAEIEDAHRLLSPLLGAAAASTVFAVGLLASGQSATIAGTLSGQIVMSGFLRVRLPPWQRRLLTRAVALVPALGVTLWAGEGATARLLVGSQILLSLALPFAVVPLLLLTSDRGRMGSLASPSWMKALGWVAAIAIIGLNAALVVAALRAFR